MVRNIVLMTLCFTLLSACQVLDISEKVSYEEGDRPLPHTLINSINKGRTSKDWVMRHLGEPDEKRLIGDNMLFTYHYQQQVKSRIRLILLFQYRQQQTRQRSLYIEFKDDLVNKVWLDVELDDDDDED
jgi:outer membrane protein assembly factor BamE (lipoprotein component of BamABCDE complex)